MLGLQVRDGALHLDPHVPEEIGRIKISRVKALGQRWDLEAHGTKGYVRLSD
jgi:hypothetical protein